MTRTAHRLALLSLLPLSFLSLPFATRSAIAQPVANNCQYGVYDAAPVEATRTISRPGFTFDVPANYRAELLANGDVAVIDPDTAQFLACMARNDMGTGNFDFLTVSKTNVRVRSTDWPYGLPGFEWFGEISDVAYNQTAAGDEFAVFQYYSDYLSTNIQNGVFNLPTGGSVMVNSAVDTDEKHAVFALVWVSLDAAH